MERKRPGFLESEFERAVATHDPRQDSDNVVELNQRSDNPWQERERRFRALLDALPAAIYTTDINGRLTYYNEYAVALWGHSPKLGTANWHRSWRLFSSNGAELPY